MPPNAPFSGEFSAINAWWHVPVPAATYGPLWMAVARMVTEFAPTLLLKMSALRLLGAALLGALVALLRAYGVPARILAVVAVNPALYFEFVLNAHNDLLPAAIIVAAAVVAPAWPALAAPLIAAAALIKAPFVLLGLPVLTRVREGSARLASAIGAVALAVAASWFAGGRAYLSALTHYASASGLENAVHALVILAALAALASAVAGARRLRTAVWLLPILAVYTAPWYALWSLPYALAARRMLTYLAVWLPFVSWLIEPSFARVWTVAIVVPLAVVLSLAPPRARQFVQPGPS
jgi:hypothetical protein